jgi:DNA-binding transcriptional ArsR family regulator
MSLTDPFAAVADPNRRILLEELRRAPSTVNALAEKLPAISRPAVSQHLKALLDSRLVDVRADGTKRIYSIHTGGFDPLNLWLDQFWKA